MTQPGDQEAHIVVVGPDGAPVGDATAGAAAGTPAPGSEQEQPGMLVEQPAKVMRIGSMIRQLLEEVRSAPLDEASRERLREVYQASIEELKRGLGPELTDELERLSLPFGENDVPSEAELRVAQAQLVGWLEGLFHGIQTALVAQQLAARAQLEQIRGRAALPPGTPGMVPPGGPGDPPQEGRAVSPTGQYL